MRWGTAAREQEGGVDDGWQHAGRRERVSDRVGGRVEVEKWDF